jgi:phospholipid/cholesterol/gamma-HCH transport system substrate-binding protein
VPSVRRVRWARFRVGSVAVVSSIIFLTLAYLLTGGTLLEPKARLYLFIPDATGLGLHSPVRVDGIGIGEVDWVGFSGSSDPLRIIRVQLTIIKSRLPSITADSIAQISNDTLVGDKFVDVTTGKAAGHVVENGELHFKPQPDLMRSVDLTDFAKQLRIVDATLDDIEQARTPLGEFVMGDQMYQDLRKRFTELENTVHRAAAADAALGSLVYTDAALEKFRAPLLEFDRAIAMIQSGQGGLGAFLRDPAQYEQFRATLHDLRQSILDVRSAELIRSDSAYFGWTQSVASIARQVDEINASPLLNVADMYERFNGAARDIGHSVKDFRENPKKYLRLKVF